MEQLESRKQLILRAVILEYVAAAEPVASEQITVNYELGVKSATVRNELADMTELGYLEQPHTSAGRIPSDRGYRYFVDHMMVEQTPNTETKFTIHRATEDGEALQPLLIQTTMALSRISHLLSAATTVRGGHLTIRSAMVSAFGPHQALAVVALSNGHVMNRMIECPQNLTLSDIGLANEALIGKAVGTTIRSLAKAKAPTVPGSKSADKLVAAVWTAMKAMSKEFTRGQLITSGEEFLFGQPDFVRNAGRLSEILDELKQSDILHESIASSGEIPSPVTIGKENRHENMHQLTVIRQSFYIGGEEAGTVAIIGPTRLNYEAAIPLIDHTAKALSNALNRTLGTSS